MSNTVSCSKGSGICCGLIRDTLFGIFCCPLFLFCNTDLEKNCEHYVERWGKVIQCCCYKEKQDNVPTAQVIEN